MRGIDRTGQLERTMISVIQAVRPVKLLLAFGTDFTETGMMDQSNSKPAVGGFYPVYDFSYMKYPATSRDLD